MTTNIYLTLPQFLENLQNEGVNMEDVTVRLVTVDQDMRTGNGEESDIYFTLECHAKVYSSNKVRSEDNYNRAMRGL